MHEGVPRDDRAPPGRGRKTLPAGQVAHLEREVRVVVTSGGDHARREVQAGRVGAALGQEPGNVPGPAADVGDDVAAGEVRGPGQQPRVERLARSSPPSSAA